MYSHLKRGQFLFQVFISLAADLPETRTVPVSGRNSSPVMLISTTNSTPYQIFWRINNCSLNY